LAEKVTNFFEQCNGAIGVNAGSQHNHYDQREVQHQLEKAQLEIERLRLEADKYRLECDNALLAMQLTQKVA
jgi:hypothetical protein